MALKGRRIVDQTELSRQEKEEEKEEEEKEEEENKGWTAADSDLAHYCHMHTFPIFRYCQLLSHASLSTKCHRCYPTYTITLFVHQDWRLEHLCCQNLFSVCDHVLYSIH